MTNIKAVDVSEIEKLVYSLTASDGERVEVIYLDDLRALLDRSPSVSDDVRKDAERWQFVTGENGYCVCKYNDSPYGAGYVPVDVEAIDKAREMMKPITIYNVTATSLDDGHRVSYGMFFSEALAKQYCDDSFKASQTAKVIPTEVLQDEMGKCYTMPTHPIYICDDVKRIKAKLDDIELKAIGLNHE